MKKSLKITLIVVAVVLVFGIVTGIVDYKRVQDNKAPIFTLRFVNGGTGKVTYIGMGYKVTRYTGATWREPFENNIGVKFGSWFMNYKIQENKPNDVEEKPNSEISMSLKNGTLTSSGLTLIMKNNSSQTYHYGPQYSLEKYENGTFKTYEPKETLTWNAVLYNIKVDEEKEEVIDWTYAYDKLQSGKYRLVRYFTADENITSSANVQEKYYVEFEIK